MLNDRIAAVTEQIWTRASDGSYTATAADNICWSIDRHRTIPSRQNRDGSPDLREKWWLHCLTVDAQDPEIHERCTIVTSASWTSLHRHPEVLRYADVLVAGWADTCWRLHNGTPESETVMRRDDAHAPLSALMGKPVMVRPELLLALELERDALLNRAGAAERALREAGLPIPLPRS
ncbi:hypothetical protein [Streptomyces sp. NPDC055036]